MAGDKGLADSTLLSSQADGRATLSQLAFQKPVDDAINAATNHANGGAKSESALRWVEHNIVNPALNAGPLGIYNSVAHFVDAPKAHLDVDAAKPYSTEWFTQSLASGAGAALPFILAAKGTGAAFKSLDAGLAGTAVGESLSPVLRSATAANIGGAMLYGGLQAPEAGHTRVGNALGMGLGFGVFAGGGYLSRDLTGIAKAASYPLTGFVGGAVMAEGSQFLSNGQTLSGDQLMQSAVQGMALNSVMPLVGKIGRSEATEPAAKVDGTVAGDKVVVMRPASTVDSTAPAEAAPTEGAAVKTTDLAGIQRNYSAWLKDNQVTYPKPEEFGNLSPEEIVNRGFYHPEATNLDRLPVYPDHAARPLPDAKVVAAEVGKSVGSMPMAGNTGDLILGEWNMEFLNGDKARYFSDSYKQIVPRHHLMFVEEADQGGLAQIAKDNNYNYTVSEANSRGQAVGFLVHPRLRVLGTQSYHDVAEVQNIPDLRPALRVDLQDTATGQKFSAVAVHLKSMRGGPEATAPIRTEQAQRLANDLGNDFSGVIAGDWNTFLDKSHELDPLKDAGFRTLNPGDHTSTQAMGGRLDGFLFKNLGGNLSNPEVRPFFKDPLITRGLSDHGLLTTHLQWNQRGN